MPSCDAVELARRMLGRDSVGLQRMTGGRNAAVWRVESGHDLFALKIYRKSEAGMRLARETAALSFLERHGIANVPRLLNADAGAGAVLLGWIVGEAVREARSGDVAACIEFAEILKELSREEDALQLVEAKESCATVAAILEQIDTRIARLEARLGREGTVRNLLDCQILPQRQALEAIRDAYPGKFPSESRTLSPSDFGTHNALKTKDGRLFFHDFEYFGWDDAVKLAADFVLHPGMSLPGSLGRQFVIGMCGLCSEESDFHARLDVLIPAFRLRWALIMMNPATDSNGSGKGTVLQDVTGRVSRYLACTTSPGEASKLWRFAR